VGLTPESWCTSCVDGTSRGDGREAATGWIGRLSAVASSLSRRPRNGVGSVVPVVGDHVAGPIPAEAQSGRIVEEQQSPQPHGDRVGAAAWCSTPGLAR